MSQKQMTLSKPQRDRRLMIIPEGTIKEEPRRAIRLPLVWLRTWIVGLLAIIALPIGGMMVLVSQAQDGRITEAWEQTSATITGVNNSSVSYTFDVNDDSRTDEVSWLTEYNEYFFAQVDGSLGARINLCDVIAPVIYPREVGAEFNVWVDPSGRYASCFPVTRDTPVILNFIGWALIIVGSWVIVTNIGRSANHRVQKRNTQPQQV